MPHDAYPSVPAENKLPNHYIAARGNGLAVV